MDCNPSEEQKRKKQKKGCAGFCIGASAACASRGEFLQGAFQLLPGILQSEIAGCGCKQKRAAAWLDGFKDGIPWGFMTFAA